MSDENLGPFDDWFPFEDWEPFKVFRKYLKKHKMEMFGGFKDFNDLVEAVKRGELKGNYKVIPINKPGMKGFMAFGTFSTSGRQLPVLDRKMRIMPDLSNIDEKREPLVDIMDQGKEIIVVAEVPGVDRENIKLDVTGKELEIDAGDKFYKKLELPVEVSLDGKATYKNGVLEVHLTKKESKTKEFRSD